MVVGPVGNFPPSLASSRTPQRLEQHEQTASLVGSASIEGGLNKSCVSPDDDLDGQPGAFDAGINPGRQF
jgi:hypothetical protein